MIMKEQAYACSFLWYAPSVREKFSKDYCKQTNLIV